MAPRTVYLHVGLHKTGTTYLQNVMRANREALHAQQVEFPGGDGGPAQFQAVLDLQGRQPRGVSDRRISGSWDRLVADVNASSLPVALISEERLSLSTLKQVRRAVGAFPDSEVHVIVTVRDLGRVTVSAWQQEIQNDQSWTWHDYVEGIKDPERAATSPARPFWMRQDLTKICEMWESAVPAARLHVVTVPPSGGPPGELLSRFASVVGVDPAKLVAEPAWTNEMVGAAATEVIRRVNERLQGRLNAWQHEKVLKMALAQPLARRTEAERFTVPTEEIPWMTERAEAFIEAVTARGYPVVGNLDDLHPRAGVGRRPDDASDAELLDAALDALTLLSEDYAKKLWTRKRASIEDVDERGGLRSRVRAIVFRAQRGAARFADKNVLAAKGMRQVLRIRDRARVRARDKKSGR